MSAHLHSSIAILLVLSVTAVLLYFRAWLLGGLYQLLRKTLPAIDQAYVGAIQGPSTLVIMALALYLSLRLYELPTQYEQSALTGMHLSLVLAVTMALANISGRAVEFFFFKLDLPFSVTSLMNAVIKITVYAVGILIMLNLVGISITPILTALGVGGLAMALALQDTLSNLFAGIHILAEHTIRVGDFIRLESGQEGHVEDISWRTTRIRVVPGNMVIVPNSKLSQSVVTNYSLPEHRMTGQTHVSVSYEADLDHVERVLIEELTAAAAEVPGMLADHPPVVKLVPGFGPSSLDYTIQYPIRRADEQPAIQHEIHKRIVKRFRREGITIPYPVQVIHVQAGFDAMGAARK